MKYFLLFLLTLFGTLASNAQFAEATGDGGYVLNPVKLEQGDAPAISIDSVQISKTQEGKWRFFLPAGAVDESVGKFYLQPRVSGEKDSREVPIFLTKVSGGYEFSTMAFFTVEGGKIFFAREKVDAFEVYSTSTPITLVPE